MLYARLAVLIAGLFVLADGPAALFGQDKGKKEDPPAKKDEPPAKKDEPTGKVKGQLPQGWGKLGLTDEQKQKVYKIQAKYGTEIDKLEAQIKDLKDKQKKERLDVLTADQKKRLETNATGGK